MLTDSARRLLRGLACLIAVVTGAWLPLAAVGSASADQVRNAQLWVLYALNVPNAWQTSQGRGVLVAVIDSGVNPGISDLAGSVTTGPDFTGVGTQTTNPGWGQHGTWMASLIAGHGHGHGGQAGIRGVAPESRILSIRVITDRSDPGYAKYQAEPPSRGQHELAMAIRLAVDHGAGVISMSLGYDTPSLAVRAALQFALNHNVVVVASSGNSGTAQTAQGQGHAPYSFPANYPGVLGVAAINRSGMPAYFSSENLSVEVAAPGVNVPAQGRDGRYWLVSGTSPACALVAGVAALIKSDDPKLTAAQIRRAITSTTTHRPPHGYDDTVGFGTVDATAALQAAKRLAKQEPAGNTAAAKAEASGYFGNGAAGAPAVPVPPRGAGLLLAWGGLAAACMLILVLSGRWLLVRKGGRGDAVAVGVGTVGPPAWTPPSGFEGTAVDLRYPSPGYPGQPFQNPPHPGQGYPGRGYPGQGNPGQGYPGQPYPGQQYPGQSLAPPDQPGQQYPGQPQPGQAFPAPGRPGQGYPAQQYPGQPQPGQAFPPPGRPGQGYPAQQYPGQAQPGQPFPAPGQPGQQYPGQPQPGQQYPGQPQPGQAFPAPGRPGQGYPGQQYPGQAQPGQPFPPPGQPGQRYPGQPSAGQPLAGQPQAAQPFPPQGQPRQGYPSQGYESQMPPQQPGTPGPPDQPFQPPVLPGRSYPGQEGRLPATRPLPGRASPPQGGPGQGHSGQPQPVDSPPARPPSDHPPVPAQGPDDQLQPPDSRQTLPPPSQPFPPGQVASGEHSRSEGSPDPAASAPAATGSAASPGRSPRGAGPPGDDPPDDGPHGEAAPAPIVPSDLGATGQRATGASGATDQSTAGAAGTDRSAEGAAGTDRSAEGAAATGQSAEGAAATGQSTAGAAATDQSATGAAGLSTAGAAGPARIRQPFEPHNPGPRDTGQLPSPPPPGEPEARTASDEPLPAADQGLADDLPKPPAEQRSRWDAWRPSGHTAPITPSDSKDEDT